MKNRLEVLTPEQAAAVLQLPVSTVRQLCAEGRIPRAAKVGGEWRILELGLAEMLLGIPTSIYPWPEVSGVYFVAADRLVKIGRANSVARRLNGAKAFTPHELHLLAVLPGDGSQERQIHERFAHLRAHGEWFSLTRELLRFIHDVRKGRAA